jgi:hypothetical protein
VLETTRERLYAGISDDAVVLDIGGWADPFERADWMIDIGSYDSRGLYERVGWTDASRTHEAERFSERTWIQRDICDHEPFPFRDNEIDFVICSQTLEDIRDPIWVCSEIARIGKRGYIEVPSRLEEQSWGVEGPYVGRHHHHWMVDVADSGLEFTFKPHNIHSTPEYHFPDGFYDLLSEDERIATLWWEGTFSARERIPFFEEGEDPYYGGFVSEQMAARGFRAVQDEGLRSRVRRAVSRLGA